jgi:cytochrome b6
MDAASRTIGKLIRFFEERFPAEKLNLQSLVGKKEVPIHRMSWAYYLGGLVLFFLGVQVVTGLLLLFYYQPTVSDAHASVDYITQHVSGGALIRNVHAWSSSAMILLLQAHLLTTFAMKAFEKPRELTWISGVLLLMLTFAFGFTGYLLPWHQIAVNATKVGLQSIEQIGQYLPGSLAGLPTKLRQAIQGEPAVGQATLSRFFAAHVVLLPLATLSVLGLHLLSVQVHGMSKGIDRPGNRAERFFPFFIIKDLSLWGVMFFVLAAIALCLPFESFFGFPLFEPYDALGSTPEGIKPEWYFYFVYYPLELLPFWLVNVVMAAITAVLLAAPWIFKGTSRRVLRTLSAGVATYLIVITLFGHRIYEIVKGGR